MMGGIREGILPQKLSPSSVRDPRTRGPPVVVNLI